MNRSELDETVRDMWSTRPRRRRGDRKIAGVAAAIGRRYGIDPVLVRIAFVVTTIFGGVGIALYLLGWLLLPDEHDQVSGAEALFGHGQSSMSKPLTVVLMIALIPAASALFSWHIAPWLSLAGVAAAAFLLHRHRGHALPPGGPSTVDTSGLYGGSYAGPYGPYGGPAAGTPYDTATGTPYGGPATGTPYGGPATGTPYGGPAAAGPGAAGPAAGASTAGPAGGASAAAGEASGVSAGPSAPGSTAPAGQAPTGHPGAGPGAGRPGEDPGRATPPEWDPLGVAPFAWDLPEPGPAAPVDEPQRRRRRSAVTPVTLALALMVAGGGAIAAMASSTIGIAEVMAATLAVVGGGLVVGSFVRGGRGLIPFAIPLALATYMTSMVPFEMGPQHGMGDRLWQASTAAEVQPNYQLSMGDATLDLSGLQLTNTEVVETDVELGMGELTVMLPPDADVEVHCKAGVGQVDCLESSEHGSDSVVDTVDVGRDGQGGGRIVLNAKVGAGHVEVTR